MSTLTAADIARLGVAIEQGGSSDAGLKRESLATLESLLSQDSSLLALRFKIQNGAIVLAEEGTTGYTALHLMAQKGATEQVQWALENRADPATTDPHAHNAALTAAHYGQTAVLKLLSEKAASTLDIARLLRKAAEYGREDTVEWLIKEKSGNPLSKGGNGETAIMLAAACCRKAVFMQLMKYPGAEETLNYQDTSGRYAIHLVVHGAGKHREEAKKIVEFLLEKNSSALSRVDSEGNTLLHWVAKAISQMESKIQESRTDQATRAILQQQQANLCLFFNWLQSEKKAPDLSNQSGQKANQLLPANLQSRISTEEYQGQCQQIATGRRMTVALSPEAAGRRRAATKGAGTLFASKPSATLGGNAGQGETDETVRTGLGMKPGGGQATEA